MNGYYTTEIDEAIESGRRTIAALEHAENALQSARNYGIWDLFGGGFISGILKHSKIEDAERELSLAQSQLRRFQKTLRNVQVENSNSIHFDNVTRVIDLFFDNVIIDIMVQSKIKEACFQVEHTRKQVQDVVRRLERYKLGDRTD